MRVSDLLRGLELLRVDPNSCIRAEHDQIYLDGNPPTGCGGNAAEDELDELGFFWITELECWSHFT